MFTVSGAITSIVTYDQSTIILNPGELGLLNLLSQNDLCMDPMLRSAVGMTHSLRSDL